MSSTSGLSSVGQGILTGFGVGSSGLNVTSLVTGLVQAASVPLTNLNTQLTANQSQISAYGMIQSSLASLQTATQSLYGSGNALAAQTASSSNTSVFSATGDGTSVIGAHAISVSQLATAQSLTSTGFSTTDFTFGGSLSIKVGTATAVPVTIATGSSLADVVTAINNTNAGVTASIVNDGTNNHLVLSSSNSGAANSFTVTGTDGAGSTNLAALTYSGGTPGAGYTTMTAAQDAKLTIDGIATTESSNSFSGALQGVTFNLQATGTSTLTIGWDTSAIDSAVSKFVSAYNSSQSTISGLTSYVASTKTAGVLNGDYLSGSIMGQLGATFSTTFSGMSSSLGSAYKGTGSLTSIGDLGIALNSDGTLSLNTTKLNAAIASNATGVMAGFSNFAQTLNTTLNSQLNSSNGSITNATTSLKSTQKNITNQQAAMQAHLDALQAQYTAQFTALQSVLAQMSSTSSYLTAQFAAMSR